MLARATLGWPEDMCIEAAACRSMDGERGRRRMVDALPIRDARVREAMLAVPREAFLAPPDRSRDHWAGDRSRGPRLPGHSRYSSGLSLGKNAISTAGSVSCVRVTCPRER